MKKCREIVFDELRRLVSDFDDAVTAGAVGAWNVDDALGHLIIRLNGETRRARKFQPPVNSEVTGDGA